MARRLIFVSGFAAAAAVAVVLAGYNSDPAAPAGEPPPIEHSNHGAARVDEEHAHKPGAHGGIIVALGRDSYHVEAVFEKGGVVRLYTLGKDEARVQEVDSQELIAFVTPAGSAEAEQVKFVPEQQPGDSPGKTSCFVATLPTSLSGKQVQVTINNLKIGGERFRLGFANETAGHADAMPAAKTSEEDRKLFFSAGGMYTEADIKANGTIVPTVKFAGIRPIHDAKPKPGQKLCPISETVSNPKFTWVVGGAVYEFCCVPCIGEFVERAKEKPEQIKAPGDYRAR